MVSELTADLQVLAKSVSIDDAGVASLTDAPNHPRFLLAYGGRYWQIMHDGKIVLRSPSLWDQSLTIPTHPVVADPPMVVNFSGPNDQFLLGLVERIRDEAKNKEFEIITAFDYAEIVEAKRGFAKDVWFGVGILAALLIMAAAAQVSVGLRPLQTVVGALSAIRNGSARRLSGNFPLEIQPLVDETNALLAAQDSSVKSANARSANLAHGLKTPLAVMAVQSRQLRRSGDTTISDELDRQIEAMRRHVERELVLSRARESRTGPVTTIDAGSDILEIVTALKKLPTDRKLDWQVVAMFPLIVTINRADFHDVIGNLLENAQKWAASRIVIEASSTGSVFRFSVDDDGPGVPEQEISRVLQRGERADTSVPGTGLGLSIVDELVAIYEGELRFERSPIGGLRVVLSMPA